RIPLRLGIVVEPHGSGVARIVVEQRLAVTRSDHEVGDIFDAGDRFVAIEQARDLAFHETAGCAKGDQRAADDVESKTSDVEVPDLADLSDAIHLRRPALDVIDPDQAGIEVRDDMLARPSRINLLERPLTQLQLVAHPETPGRILESGE